MAPLATVKRPAQYKQSSRKGKKAWRKNIDLTDIEQSIETRKEQEITHGTPDIGSLKDDALFQVDDTGDAALKSKLIKRKQIKKNLKSKEILEAVKSNSKVGVVKHPKYDEQKHRIQTVSKKELRKLMALAGKIDGESKIKNHIAKDGLVKSEARDIWTAEESSKIVTPAGISLEVDGKTEVPESLLRDSATGWSIASVKPKTLDAAPVKVRDIEEIPHAGKSYNPDKADWSSLVEQEYKLEKVKEDNRVALQQYRERIQKLMDILDDSEEEASSDEEDEDEEEEDNEEKLKDDRLSINEPVKNKKKTKYQRNRARKHEEKIKLQQELKKLKARVKDLEKLEETEKQLQQEDEQKKSRQAEPKRSKINKKHRLGTKYSARESNLELKFSDELSDSLRKLRPEGNLLYDQMHKLQSSGKIESRVPIKKSRRYKQKITEKWTHKDFK
ncbi:hypothetical protein HG537_0F02110 [Torulaspora globosa]|uniref:Ribosome biogenesis protein NOP53 n=1 Tax=Torulaspora globosa TaxID=48254 RepID=A0A7H9HVP8_9SACH|nr:hypothetical protein HG537_0F02110 [Torulaspora sp. CBS 2947]